MGIFIEKSRGERTGDASTILFPNYMESVQKQELIQKAKDLKSGDFVSWNSSGGRARGKIVHIMREGVLGVPDSKFKINAQPDDPAVLIQLYRDGEETETFVGHKMSTLSGASSMSKESPTMNTVHVDSVMGGKKKKKKAMDANGLEIEIELEEDEEEDDVEMAMGGYGYDMSEKPKKKVTKHGDHDQSSHGNWAGNSGSSSGGYKYAPKPIKSDVFESKRGSIKTSAGVLNKIFGKGKIVQGDEFERKVTTQWNFEMKNPKTGKNFKGSVYDFMRYDKLGLTAEQGQKLPPMKSSDKFNFSIAAPTENDASVVADYIKLMNAFD
jgi:hypothetical protein